MAFRPGTFAVSFALLSLGCGKKPEANSAVEASKANVIDTYSLFPASAIGLGTLNVNALFKSGKSGEALAHLLSTYSPLGPESGFSIDGSVDRLTCASYQLETADVLCVVDGRFDAERLDKAITDLEAKAKADPALAGKAPAVVRTPYAGRTLITAANVGFTVFDATHLLAGTEPAMRRALDRVRDGAIPERALVKSLVERVVDSKDDVAVAYSFEGHAFRAIAAGPIKIRILQGLKEAYGSGNFKKKTTDAGTISKTGEPGTPAGDNEPDVVLVTHLVYADEAKAEAEKDEVATVLGFASFAGAYAPKISKKEVTAKGNETILTLGFRDAALARWVEGVPEQFGLPAPTRSAGATGPVPGADAK